MSEQLFGGNTEVPANVEAKPEAKVDGNERTFTGAEIEQIVKDRILREAKKTAKLTSTYENKIAELEEKLTSGGKAKANVEEDLRAKLSKYDDERKALSSKLSQYRNDSLAAQVERALVAHDCLDPEIVRDHFLGRRLVELDDDDSIVVNNETGRLDDLVKDYLDKKPHLRRGTSQGGTGSKGPSRPAISKPLDVANAKNWTAEEFEAYKASQNIKSNGGKSRLF
jgi:hypothetical protein